MTLVTIAAADYAATIDTRGGGLQALRYPGRPLTTSPSRDERPGSWDGAVLAPWPNRLDGARYRYRRVEYALPVNEPELGTALHGTVWSNDWDVAEHGTAGGVQLRTLVRRSEGYPWTVELDVTYSIDDAGLAIRARAANLGDGVAPFGFGIHRYLLAPGGALDQCQLTFAATTRLVTDDRLIPVGKVDNVSTEFDFTTPRPIGSTELDTAFGGVARAEHGRSSLTLSAPDHTSSITCWWDESFPWLQLDTRARWPGCREGSDRRRADDVPAECVQLDDRRGRARAGTRVVGLGSESPPRAPDGGRAVTRRRPCGRTAG